MARRVLAAGVPLVPGALVVYFAFNAGGFFPNTQALVAIGLLFGLAAWVAFADRPFAGLSPALAVAAVAFAGYAAWTLASGLWSESTSRALLEFNRVLLYLVALLLFGLAVRRTGQLQTLVWGLVSGIVVVCTIGLTTRLLPDVWPIGRDLVNDRMSYPVTYWNALGLLASLGIVFCLQMTTRARGSRITRVLGAAAIPLLATTVYFTFSRGAILAGGLGVVAYLVVARARGTVSGLLATVPAAAIALVVAYQADVLATEHPASEVGTSQGHHVAKVLAACVVGCGAGSACPAVAR